MAGSTLLKRLAHAGLTLLGVVTLVFFLQRLSGDPVLLLVPENATQADIQMLRHSLGFDRPVVTQYLEFLTQAARLDLGTSLVQQIPVSEIIASRVPYTLALAAGALAVALLLGLPAGVFLALQPRHWLRAPLETFLAAVQSLPTFWSGMLLVLVFAITLGWLPPSSSGSWRHLVLPSLALGLMSLATFARVTRAALAEELGREYVLSALSRGVPPMRLLLRHLSRNAALPLLSITGLEIANLLAGAVIVENLFAWPGLGQLTLQAILARDFPLVQAVVMLGAAVTIGLNLVTELLYGVVDPRIARQEGRA